MTKQLLVLVAVLCFAVTAQAAVTLSVATSVNSQGDDLYIVTATSDDAPISSLGILVESDGNLGQVSPFGLATHLQDNNAVIVGSGGQVDQDTQGMFSTTTDNLIVVPGFSDTTSLLDTSFTGFEPFQSREVVQIVLTQGEAIATIGIVAGGVEYSVVPTAQGTKSALVPEPASLMMLALGSLIAIRRR